ncbi:MAG: cysteine dioxygenase [Planctomycetota bacterium]|jgi:cysteine dioxygenase
MTLDDFFTDLDQHADCVPIDELVELMKRVEFTRADIEHAISFSDEHYKRNMLRLGNGYAALILCWKPGQASPVHDHRGSACGVRVISGSVTETRYRRGADGMLTETETCVHDIGNVCGSYDEDIHVIRNADPDGHELITLHVYTPPLENYRVYSLGSTEVKVCSDEETLAERRRLATAR